jgi:hypothetical protein
MLYTARVKIERFEKLAETLARRDEELGAGLEEAREAAERLRGLADAAVEGFRRAARARGAPHLAHLEVGGVEPDEKHVDCVQFGVRRGRWEALCVAKASGKVTLVGPFKRGKTEKPCLDVPLHGAQTESALDDLLLRLIEQASER